MKELQWTGLGCDCCGFGTVEDCGKFDPRKPCPECESVMLSDTDPSAMYATIHSVPKGPKAKA
jgi:hypothetical protein